MYKLSTFLAETDRGYSAVPLFGPADAVFEKTASADLLPEVLRYIENLKPRAGSQYVLVNAMGAGEYFGCFPAGTLVDTEGGDLPIEQVTSGTRVRTHQNRYQEVKAVLPKQAEELCDLQVQGLPGLLPTLTATPNHELWVVTREEFLKKQRKHVWGGDRTESLVSRRVAALEVMDFSWVPIAHLQPGDMVAEPFPLEEDPAALGDDKWNTPEVAFLMGLYAAEGCVAYRYDHSKDVPASVICVVGGHEHATVTRAREAADTLGHGLQDYLSDSETSSRLQLCSTAFAQLCLQHIGTPAVDKYLSPELLRMPRAWQQVFFDAYAAGDGCVRGPGKEEGTVRCVSASAELLRGMRLILARLGHVASISGRHNRKASWYNGNPVYELMLSGGQLRGRGAPKSYLHPDGFIMSAVKTVRQYEDSCKVYDLSVDCDNSYTANGLTVHNSNINGDHFEEAGLIHKPDAWKGLPVYDRPLGQKWTYGFPTFYNAHPYLHHRNKDSTRAYGEVEFAGWNPHMHRVELVCRIDYDKCVQFGGMSVWDKLKEGMFPDVSMGSKVCYDLSSITTDWKLYREALDTFDPKKHAYPGLAALEFHKKLKAKDGKGVPGLSITRADYDEWTRNHMNQILPDGRKVWVYNPYPRFFDISFVFIGADRTAKTMVFIVRHGDSRYVPSAEAGEKVASSIWMPEEPEFVTPHAKVASVHDAALSYMFGKSAADKKAEIKKEVPADAAVTLLEKSDKDLPEEALRALSAVPEGKALGTTAAMGIVLKPKEFQRITLLRLGKRHLADELDAENKVFPRVSEALDLAGGSFLPALAKLLLPLLEERSAFGPFSSTRVVLSHNCGASEPASHSSEELRKISAAYNGYRQALMDMVATTQDVLHTAAPADSAVAKLASAPPEEVFTPLTFAYLKEAHLPPISAEALEVLDQKNHTASVTREAPSQDTSN